MVAWTPGIGDPTLLGWTTVVAYFVAAWLCLRAFKAEKRGPERPFRHAIPALLRVLRKHRRHPPLPARRAALWLALAVLLLALGVNKQLDLQTLVTDIGRALLADGGLYEHRRTLQAIFVAVVATIGIAVLGLGVWVTRGSLRDFRPPLAGLAFLLTFVVVRAASFHHVDVLIKTELAGIRVNGLFELGGIAVIAVAAARCWAAAARHRRDSGRVVQLEAPPSSPG